MPEPLIRYPLDRTGTNPDNLVVEEVKTLSVNPYRPAFPSYGPFFSDSLVVRDHNTNALLVKDSDYKNVQLLRTPTLDTGKEIYEGIVVINPNVSGQIRLTYQTLGGLYQQTAQSLDALYNAFLADDRPVDWLNVLNKPATYPPSLHNHLLSDVFGFGPVVTELERIRNAIVLTDVPAFEAVIDLVRSKIIDRATTEDIDTGLPVDRAITLETLIYALSKFNFNSTTISPSKTTILPGVNVAFNISTTAVEDNTTFYWAVDHITTNDSDFNMLSGSILMNDNKGSFNISVPAATVTEIDETFRISIRRNSPTGPSIGTTGVLTIAGLFILAVEDYIKAFSTCCVLTNEVTEDLPLIAETLFLITVSK